MNARYPIANIPAMLQGIINRCRRAGDTPTDRTQVITRLRFIASEIERLEKANEPTEHEQLIITGFGATFVESDNSSTITPSTSTIEKD